MSALSRDQQIQVIGCLTEGMSIRSIERLTGIHRDTIMRLGARIGRGCAELHDRIMVGLRVGRIEMDELWAFVSAELWDVDEPDRFAKLAIRYPEMLTHDEQVLWKLIQENGSLWMGHFDEETKEWTWQVRQHSLIIELLRKSWEAFRSVAYENGSKDKLPTWKKVDDEIPF